MKVKDIGEEGKRVRLRAKLYKSLTKQEEHILNIIGYIFIKCNIKRQDISDIEIIQHTKDFLEMYKYGKSNNKHRKKGDT